MTGVVAWLAQSTPAPATTTDYGAAVVRNLVVFLLAMACLYALGWYVARRLRGGAASRDPAGIEVVASTPLEPGKRVHLVRFRGREWLVASAPSQCSVIAEVTPEPATKPEPFTMPRSDAGVAPDAPPARGTPT